MLLRDEAARAMDAQVRTELCQCLRRLHDVSWVTTVPVTRDQEEALEVADNLMKASADRMLGQRPENDRIHFRCPFQHHHMTCVGDLMELGTGDALVQEFTAALGFEEREFGGDDAGRDMDLVQIGGQSPMQAR